MAPEVFHQIGNKKQSGISIELTDKQCSWSLGLTLLEACLLKSVQPIYDRKNYRIDRLKLNEMIREAADLYFQKNSLIIDVFEMLLQIEPTKRLTCEEVLQTLPDFDQIRSGFDKNSYKSDNSVAHNTGRSIESNELGSIKENRHDPHEYLKNDKKSQNYQNELDRELNKHINTETYVEDGGAQTKMLTEEEFLTMHKPQEYDTNIYKEPNSRTQFYVTRDPEVIEVIDERPSEEARFSSQRHSFSPPVRNSHSPNNDNTNYANPVSVGKNMHKDHPRMMSKKEMHQEAQHMFPGDFHAVPRPNHHAPIQVEQDYKSRRPRSPLNQNHHAPIQVEQDYLNRRPRSPLKDKVVERPAKVREVREIINQKVTYIEHPPREVYRERSRSHSRKSRMSLAEDEYLTNEYLDTENAYNMHGEDPYCDAPTIKAREKPVMLGMNQTNVLDIINKDLARDVVDLRAQLNAYDNGGHLKDQHVVGKRIGMENPMMCYSNLVDTTDDDPYIFKPEIIHFDKNIGLKTEDIHRKYIDSFEPKKKREQKTYIKRDLVKDKNFYNQEKKRKLEDRKKLFAKYTNVNCCVRDRVKLEMEQNQRNLRNKRDQNKVAEPKPTPVVKEEIRAGLMKKKYIDKTYMKDAWDSELNKKLWHYNKNCLKNTEEKLKENYYPVNNTMYHITRDCLDTFPSKEERISISKDRRRFFCTKNGKINDHMCMINCTCCEEYDESNVKHMDTYKHWKHHDEFNHGHMGHCGSNKKSHKHVDYYKREKHASKCKNLRSTSKDRHACIDQNLGCSNRGHPSVNTHCGHKQSTCCDHGGECTCRDVGGECECCVDDGKCCKECGPCECNPKSADTRMQLNYLIEQMESSMHCHPKHVEHIDICMPEIKEVVEIIEEIIPPPPKPIKVEVIKTQIPPCKTCEIPKKQHPRMPDIRKKEPVGKTLVERSFKVCLNGREYEDLAWRNYAYMLNAQDVTQNYMHKADSMEQHHVDDCGHYEESERYF